MNTGQFNTDAAALKKRIEAHDKYSAYDLNQWILGHMELIEGLSVLELGCGTGKQTLPIANIVGQAGHIRAMDISQEALDTLLQGAKDLKLDKRITTIKNELDELAGQFEQNSFDRMLASYSLYYVRDPKPLFEILYDSLKENGIFFFCGPSKNNNLELKQFHYALKGQATSYLTDAAIFMEETGQTLARDIFRKVETYTFENPLSFDSPGPLYEYWCSYNLYDKSLDAKFKVSAENYFQSYAVFKTTKRVIGIKATK